MERIKVVVRYVNGKLLKGTTIDFFPNKDRFHVTPIDKPHDKPMEIIINQLKAVFVVRDFKGVPQYVERKGYREGESPYGSLLEVTFADGEVLLGSCMSFDLKRQGFFIFPTDPKSNNLRIFVVYAGLKNIRQLLTKTGEYLEIPIPGRKK
ncbi:MAG: hypothetical protein FJ115_07605 [Deltaproteobacteria bacterium]|nr:hypothetical protein [Deltaproteobacteria bacterium]MBM4323405.1 hypothetical protein [Deltaproteobacteria bacterium]MBM4346524.1 hypothetical protein [Deltaproteobacteria bacterium]